MAKKSTATKSKKRLIRLVSSANTGHFYTTTRPKEGSKMQIKKFDPVIRERVLYTERKIK